MNRIFSVLFVLLCLLGAGFLGASAGAAPSGGEHKGEEKQIDYDFEFLDYWWIDAEGYPVYMIGWPMHYRMTITNTGERTFKHLYVVAEQEYYEDISGITYFGEVDVEKGDALPGASTQSWYFEELRGGESLTIDVYYTAPWGTAPGLDQIHLTMYHWKPADTNAEGLQAPGRPFVDDDEAAVYCPPAPE